MSKEEKHDYDIYKENHPSNPKKFVNVFDIGYLGVEKYFLEQLSFIPNRKQRNQELSQDEKQYNQNHSKKKNSDRTCHLQIKKVQDNERHIQK